MIRIVPLTREHLDKITRIHISSLKNDFLPTLGFSFLKALYKGLLGKSGIYGFVAVEEKKILGFVIGTNDINKFLKTCVKSNFAEIFYHLLIRIIQKPQLIRNAFETLTYSSKDIGSPAELVVIAVNTRYRSKGIGRFLINDLEKKFMIDRIKKYKLTVHADKKAVGFYEHLGYRQTSSFFLYDKMWYVYEKSIKPSKKTS